MGSPTIFLFDIELPREGARRTRGTCPKTDTRGGYGGDVLLLVIQPSSAAGSPLTGDRSRAGDHFHKLRAVGEPT